MNIKTIACLTIIVGGLMSLPSVLWAETSITGAVYKKQNILTTDGHLVYVELNEFGLEVDNAWTAIKAPDTPYWEATVYSASYYNALRQQYSSLMSQYEGGDPDIVPVLLSRQEYEEARNNNTFITIGNETITGVPELEEGALTVVVVHPQRRYETDGSKLILLQLPIDPEVAPLEETKSVLLSEHGVILHQSPEIIGYRSGYFGKDNELVVDYERAADYQILGPLPFVEISALSGYARTASGEDGKYYLNFQLSPCVGFFYSLNIPIQAKLYVRQFNPKSNNAVAPITMTKLAYDVCSGFSEVGSSYDLSGLQSRLAASVIESGIDAKNPQLDFPVDLMVLSGQAQLRSAEPTTRDTTDGAIVIDEEGQTLFDGSLPQLQRVSQQQYDFDGDGVADVALLGRKDADGVFTRMAAESDPTPPSQGVWLSGRHGGILDALRNLPEEGAEGVSSTDAQAPVTPDLLRLTDWDSQFDNYGLLTQISEADLQDTDIYVFREANGKLLQEIKGIDLEEVGNKGGPANLYYTIGLMDLRAVIEAQRNDGAFWLWGNNPGGLNPKLYRSYTESLAPGEQVRIIVINRASGYMGSQRVTLQGAERMVMDFEVAPIILRPPNLRIWAERKSKIELGMTKDKINQYLIGNEGAGLNDDYYLVVYTEWLDHDGAPLPDELLDYGYTARLAYIYETNKLTATNFAGNFEIKPGSRMQLIKLPEGEEAAGPMHYYVQVSGQPSTRNPSFAGDTQTGALQYRPDKLVPVLTPVYDEEASLLAKKAWQHLNDVPPEPVYQWVYRPEYQFSVYDLTINELLRVTETGEQVHLENSNEPPAISYTDLYFSVDYSLQESEFGQLDTYSYEDRELVFALGEYEATVTVGADETIDFWELEHMSLLQPEDYIALELYANSDAGNILWEYSFASIYVEKTDEEFPDVPLRWDDYYPQLGAKTLNIRSTLDNSNIEGRRVKAEVTHVTEGGEATVTAISTTAATAIFEQDNDGKYRAKFKLDGPDLEPSFPYNPRVDHVEIKFSLLEAAGTAAESSVTEKWFIKNNSNTDLEEVLAGEAVFVYDGNEEREEEDTRKGVSTDTVKRFEEVQEMINQVVPRKRTVTNEVFSYVEMDGIYGEEMTNAIGTFKEYFMVHNRTMNNNQNSFHKLDKDYVFAGGATAEQMSNKIVDMETLVGTTFSGVEQTPNLQAGGDAGLYELYHNTVVPFNVFVIIEAERFIDEPTQDWVPRYPENNRERHPFIDYTNPGPGMSYCYGCKQLPEEFNATVANCQAPMTNTIKSWDDDDDPNNLETLNNNYRGNLSSHCVPDINVEHGGYRYAGRTKDESDSSDLVTNSGGNPRPGRVEFNRPYWSGIDCAGHTQYSIDFAATSMGAAVRVKIPSTVQRDTNGLLRENVWNAAASHDFYVEAGDSTKLNADNFDRVFSIPCEPIENRRCNFSDSIKALVRPGDMFVKSGHVSLIYSRADNNGQVMLIHAYGVDIYNSTFSRKVLAMPHSRIDWDTGGLSRLRLWD